MVGKMSLRALASIAGFAWSVGLLGSGAAQAASCGTVAAPIACSTSVGQMQFDFGAFSFLNNGSTGGAFTYTAADIAIDLALVGSAPIITFSKVANVPNPGTTFFANANETSFFLFSYEVTATPLSAGTIDFQALDAKIFESTANNGFAQYQSIASGQGNCSVFSNSATKTCPLTGSGPLSMGSIVTLTGNNGNASILNFSSKFTAAFTAAPPPAVPEPASWALLMLGFGCAGGAMRRQARTGRARLRAA